MKPSGTALYIGLHSCTGCREFDFHWMLPSVFEVHALNDRDLVYYTKPLQISTNILTAIGEFKASDNEVDIGFQ